MRMKTQQIAEKIDSVLTAHPSGFAVPDLARRTGLTVQQVQRGMKFLAAEKDVNYSVPCYGNGYRVTRSTSPIRETYRGELDQIKHLSTRLKTGERRAEVQGITAVTPRDRKIANARSKQLASQRLGLESHAELLQLLADMSR